MSLTSNPLFQMSNPSYRSIPPNPEFRPATKMWNNEDGRRGATGAPATKSSGKIEQTQKQVNEVIDVMKDNVNRVLERGDRLADLDERADALQFGAHQFQATAKKVKRKYWWKNLKMWIIIGVIVLVIIAIIAISVGTQSSTPSVAPVPAATTVAPPPPQPATAGKT